MFLEARNQQDLPGMSMGLLPKEKVSKETARSRHHRVYLFSKKIYCTLFTWLPNEHITGAVTPKIRDQRGHLWGPHIQSSVSQHTCEWLLGKEHLIVTEGRPFHSWVFFTILLLFVHCLRWTHNCHLNLTFYHFGVRTHGIDILKSKVNIVSDNKSLNICNLTEIV